MRKHLKTTGYLGLVLLSTVLLLLNFYLIKTLDVFGLPLLFIVGLAIELALLVALVYFLLVVLKAPLLVIRSVAGSAWDGIKRNTHIRKLEGSQNHLTRWLKARFNSKSPIGLPLTATVIIATIFLFNFFGVLQDVIFKAPLTKIDTRIVNLVPSIRTNEQTKFFSFVTFLANWESVLLLVALAAFLFWRRKQKWLAALFIGTFAVVEIATFTIKHLVGRMRPEQVLSLIQEDTYSFPSGHVLRATVIFGLLAYFIFRSFKSHTARLLSIIGCLIIIVLVALSRVYLGVHYPSDVLASFLLGAFLLTILIGSIEIGRATRAEIKKPNRRMAWVPLVVASFAIIASPIFIRPSATTPTPVFQTISQVNAETVNSLPIYSETLTGAKMEPISFIYIGYQDQLEKLFVDHGWSKADPSTLANTLKAFAVGLQGKQYPNAPVTPSYLDAKPQDLAFEKATSLNTLRQRHHTRIWRTSFELPDHRPVWVATASFDEGVEFAGAAKLPTHHINPNIDAERTYIAQSLGLTSPVFIPVVEPQIGKNASGDQFFTDGRAVIINLR